jgi:hypothetical protein
MPSPGITPGSVSLPTSMTDVGETVRICALWQSWRLATVAEAGRGMSTGPVIVAFSLHGGPLPMGGLIT